ncbi:MAG TPA: hypothetical protein VFG23_11895 [Polyangia bacterium]|nr:hypothetical protein [Polyangia bacterium]
MARTAALYRRTFPDERVRAALAIGAHLLTLALTAYVFLILNKRFYYASQNAYDEPFFVWGGWSITKGLAPYRDFLEFKPPMVFITHAWAQDLFGFKDLGYRKFFTLFPLASLLLLQGVLIARGIGRWLALAVVVGVVVLFVSPTWHDTALTDCESIGLTYYILGLAFLLWEGRGLKMTTVTGGALLACCVFSKEPFAPVVGFTWLGLFWLRGKPTPSRRSVQTYAVYSLLGVAAFVAALCVYMVPTGALKAYVALVRSYSVIYRDPKRSYCVAVGAAHPTTALVGLQIAWEKIRLRFLNLGVLGYLAPIALPGAIFVFRRSKVLLAVVILAFAGALWAFTATACHWMHYFNMSMAGVVFVLVVGADSMRGDCAAARLTRWLACLATLALIVGFNHRDFTLQQTAHYTRKPWVEPVPGVLDFIKQNTTPAERIFTTGPPMLYPEADRLSAVRESNIIDEILGSYDGDTDEEKLRPIRQQLDRNKPKVVVLDPEHVSRKGRTYRVLMMPFLAAHKYQKVRENLYLLP